MIFDNHSLSVRASYFIRCCREGQDLGDVASAFVHCNWVGGAYNDSLFRAPKQTGSVMGFFDFLFESKKPKHAEFVLDRIWITSDAKFTGLEKEAVERSRTETVAILLVAHFPDVLARLEAIANRNVWDVPCMAVSAGNLNSGIAGNLNLDESATIDIIVGERHPLRSMDNRLEEFANWLPCRCRISHHLSLEDAMMQALGAGDWVKMLMTSAMPEDESIENELVSHAVLKAQQKLEGRAIGNVDSESATEWLRKNCLDLPHK